MDHPSSAKETTPTPGFWPRLLSHLTLPGVRLETKIFVGFATVLLLLCAFGLFTLHNLSRVREEAAAGGYFGARLVGGEFIAWFHWPVPRK